MLKLIQADILANRGTVWGMLVFFVLISASLFLLGHQLVLVNVLFAVALISALMQTAGKYNAHVLYCSLPIKRHTLVLSRYVWVLLVYGVVTLLSFLVALFYKWSAFVGVKIPEPLLSTNYVFVPGVVLLFSYAVVLPFYFRWGYGRGVFLGTIAMAGILALVSAIFNLIIKANVSPEIWNSPIFNQKLPALQSILFKGIFRGMLYFDPAKLRLIFAGITTIVLIISIYTATVLFRKKEL